MNPPFVNLNPFNDNTVKKLVVCTLKIDYQLTTIDYYILPQFALFCVMRHILQILCGFYR